MDHPNILTVYDFYEDEFHYYIVSELCTGGELFDKIIENGTIDESSAATIMKEILSAMTYCHKYGIVHRDLKPENLLYDNKFQLKVADFGFSAMINKNNDGKLYTILGTQNYMAPEIHEELPYEGAQVDLFAAGVILFIMKSGHPPFGMANKSDPYYKLFLKKPKKFWKFHEKTLGKGFYSNDYKVLLTKMFSYNPKKRPTIDNIL